MPRPSRWDEIVQAAAEEFREHGYDGATIEAIASRVGILKGSIYNYIQNKDDLLFAVIEEPAQRLLDELTLLTASADRSAARRLHRLVHAQVRTFADHYPAAFVYLQQLGRPSHREDFREMDARYIRAVEAIIQDGIDRGEFSSQARPAIAARAFVGILDWMQHWFVPRGAAEDAAVADELYAIAVGGLASAGLVHAAMSVNGEDSHDEVLPGPVGADG
jgi:TetR/AcrR family transcriptional regulator, cholesterol catabolism regulator